LDEILQREYDLCVEMIELLKREKDVITRLNANELEQLLREKEMLTFKIKRCDEQRDRLLAEMGLEHKTLKEVALMAEGERRDKMLALSEEFTRVIQTIRDLNRINSMLIAKSLHYIKTSYNFLTTFNINPREKLSVEA
jgi:flagellar biosynthesis/type III secretory pathway chaperone